MPFCFMGNAVQNVLMQVNFRDSLGEEVSNPWIRNIDISITCEFDLESGGGSQQSRFLDDSEALSNVRTMVLGTH